MTGATGAVGLPLYQQLEADQEIICIVRNAQNRNGLPFATRNTLNGDVSLKNCGLSESDIDFLKTKDVSKIIHLAGLVKFDQELKDEIWAVNHEGTKNILSLAKSISVKEFHHVSTAYAYGKHRNPYEASKYEAEKLVSTSGIPFSIYRIGIVIGDSQSGVTNGFDGYYGFFSGLHDIANVYRKKFNLEGEVDIPINLICSKTSTLNLVPIDWLVDALQKLINKGGSGKIFHVVNPEPPLVYDVMRQGLAIIGINGARFVESQEELGNLGKHCNQFVNIIQKGINKVLRRYEPYVTHEEKFPTDELAMELGEIVLHAFPHTNPQLLNKCLNYALSANFGKSA